MSSILEIVARLLALTALFAWANQRFLKLPNNVGILAMGLCASIVLVVLEVFIPQVALFGEIEGHIQRLNFSEALLDGMLAFLLFAGALRIDLSLLRDRAWIVGAMATLGVIISTILVGVMLWGAGQILWLPIPFAWALVFGALISPTDPVAVLAVLKQARVAKTLEMDMAGESLFNDGVGVVLFTILLAAAMSGAGDTGIDFAEIAAEAVLVHLLAGLPMPEPAPIRTDLVAQQNFSIVTAELHLEVHQPDVPLLEKLEQQFVDFEALSS